MRFADAEKTVLIINEHVQLMGIREAVHRYVVNGRTPRRLSEPRFMGFRDLRDFVNLLPSLSGEWTPTRGVPTIDIFSDFTTKTEIFSFFSQL